MNMKPRILFILHLPPPIHGAAMVGKYITSSRIINESFNSHYINLTTAYGLDTNGRYNLKKVYTILEIQIKVIKALLTNKFDLCYITLNSAGPSFYKDLITVAVLKVFRNKIIYHF